MNEEQVEVVLVEDNPDDARLTIRALKKQNIANNLVHLKDGEEALDFFFATGPFAGRNTNNMPRVVLLDLKMPKINGIEVLAKLKANEKTRSIPVVVLTSSAEDPDIEKCYALGANSYIVKPVNFDDFMKAVSEMGMYWVLLNKRV